MDIYELLENSLLESVLNSDSGGGGLMIILKLPEVRKEKKRTHEDRYIVAGPQGASAPTADNFLLLQDGDNMLLQDGSNFLLQ